MLNWNRQPVFTPQSSSKNTREESSEDSDTDYSLHDQSDDLPEQDSDFDEELKEPNNLNVNDFVLVRTSVRSPFTPLEFGLIMLTLFGFEQCGSKCYARYVSILTLLYRIMLCKVIRLRTWGGVVVRGRRGALDSSSCTVFSNHRVGLFARFVA
ncbi:hypothetical protein FQR65_LT13794 [Abscondita terminalis]|nr:hypothetical protein FQR65_LT13794 [Abscondita terminalis]